MAVRLYAAFAALLAVVMLLYAADRQDVIRLPWRPAPEAGLQSALVGPSSTIDLETGSQGAAQADLRWAMQARDQPYLGAYQGGSGKGALIAEAGAALWEVLDEAALAKLSYSDGQYSAWGPDAPARKGAVFGV